MREGVIAAHPEQRCQWPTSWAHGTPNVIQWTFQAGADRTGREAEDPVGVIYSFVAVVITFAAPPARIRRTRLGATMRSTAISP